MSSMRRTILRKIDKKLSGRYPWGNTGRTGNRKSRRTTVKEK